MIYLNRVKQAFRRRMPKIKRGILQSENNRKEIVDMKLITGIKTQSYAESIQHGMDTRCTLAIGYLIGILLGELIGPLYIVLGGEKCFTYYIGMLLLPFVAAYGAIYADFYGRGKAVNRKIRYVLPGMASAGGSSRYWIQVPAFKDDDGEVKPVTYSKEWMLTTPLRFLTGLLALLPELLILFLAGLMVEVGVNNPVLKIKQPESVGELPSYIVNEVFPFIGRLFSEMWKGLPDYAGSLITPVNLLLIAALTMAFTFGSWSTKKAYKKNPLKDSIGAGLILMLIALILLFYNYTRDVVAGVYTITKIFG